VRSGPVLPSVSPKGVLSRRLSMNEYIQVTRLEETNVNFATRETGSCEHGVGNATVRNYYIGEV
jgi:hypothetical protein